MKQNIAQIKLNIDYRKKDDLVNQIIDSIKTDIIQLRFEHGQMLPPINDISVDNKIDTSSIVLAFDILVNQGFLTTKDTNFFINRHRFIDDFKPGPKKIVDSVAEQGLKARFETKLVEYVNKLPQGLASISKNKLNKYIHIQRLFYSNDIPFSLVDFYYDATLLPDFNHTNYDQLLTYDFIKSKYPSLVTRSTRLISASKVSNEITRLLNIPSNTPLLCINYIGYAENNDEIEYVIGYSSSNYEISELQHEII